MNHTQQFLATVNGTQNAAVTWSIQEGAVGGTITPSGFYTPGTTAGVYHIIVTSVADPTKKATSVVTVVAVSVSVSPQGSSINMDGTQQFTSVVSGGGSGGVIWSCSTPSLITSGGLFTGSQAGTCTVTATSVDDPQKQASTTITVVLVVVEISPKLPSLKFGASQQFVATVSGAGSGGVVWSCSNPSLINSVGLFTGMVSGNHTVTATSVDAPLKSASTTVSVEAVAVSILPGALTLNSPTTQQYLATVTGSLDQSVVWSCSNSGNIDSSGLFTASQPGTYTITATSVANPVKSASSVVTVQQVSLDIAPLNTSVAVKTQQFTATVTGTSNTSVIWSCSGGSISSSGLFTANGGSYTVTATSVADPTKSVSTSITIDVPTQFSVGSAVYSAAMSSDGQSIALANNFGVLQASQNAGATWVGTTQGNWYDVAASNSGTTMYAVGVPGVYKSIDSGVTWSLVRSVVANYSYQKVACSSDGSKVLVLATKSGVASGIYKTKLFYTSNAGATWTEFLTYDVPYRTPTYYGATITDITMSSDGTIMYLVSSENYGLFRSMDSGNTWTKISATGGYGASVDCSDNGQIVFSVTSLGGEIYRSTDFGVTVTEVNRESTDVNGSSVAMSSDGTNIVVARKSYLYRSTDSGTTWRKKHLTPAGSTWQFVGCSADGSKILASAVATNGGLFSVNPW